MSEKTLYERLGGADGVAKLARDIFTNHANNPLIKQRYQASDPENVVRLVTEMIGAGTGGPEVYTGQDMLTAHKGMNISDQEFNAVIDDVMDAMNKNNLGETEKNEMLCILWSMKNEIVHV